MFFLVLGGLTLLAVLFCWPLWRGKQSKARPRNQTDAYNTALYRQYAAELNDDLSLDEETRAALLADKARQLLDDSAQNTGLETSLHQAAAESVGQGQSGDWIKSAHGLSAGYWLNTHLLGPGYSRCRRAC